MFQDCVVPLCTYSFYTLSEAWSGVNWADLMASQGAFGTDFYDILSLNAIPKKIFWFVHLPGFSMSFELRNREAIKLEEEF